MQIVFAPDARAETLARKLAGVRGDKCFPAKQTIGSEKALVLVTPDYYSSALWQMKRWLSGQAGHLADALCACLVLCDGGGGGELALRSLVSQLMEMQSAVYLCAVACADGRIRPGGCTEACKNEMTPLEFYTKFRNMAKKFG